MTQTVDYDIVGSYNNQRVTSIDAERSVNVFEYIDPLGKKPKSLINTSGLINTQIIFSGATFGFRAQFVFNTIEYSVIGNSVYRRPPTGVASLIGTINTFNGYVGIDANTFQIIFVDGQNGWIWDTVTATFKQITDPAFPNLPIDVCYLDGFFVVPQGSTNNFQLSMFNQGLIWGPDHTMNAGNTFNTSIASANIVLTTGTTANYQIGTPVVFSGATLPAALVAGTTYYVSLVVNSTTFQVSATDGGTSIIIATMTSGNFVTNNGQLQQGSITSHPGNIVACRTLHRRLFLFSSFYTEIWENAGIGTNLPFRRNNALLMEYGTPAIGSIAVGFDMLFFQSQDRDGLGSVMEVIGTEAIPVSNRALDFQLAQYATLNQISDCRAFLIKENGLIFYRMNFTLANHTWVYNVTLSKPNADVESALLLWHEEEQLDGTRHPAQTHSFLNGVNFVGDYLSPTLYQVSSDIYTNGATVDSMGNITSSGTAIRRMRITKAFVPPGYQRIRIDRLQIDLLQGQQDLNDITFIDLDLLSEDGNIIDTESGLDILLEQSIALNNPQRGYVFLSISKDGGQTYGYSVRAPIGDIGQRTFRTLWRKLGTTKRGQAFVAKFEFFEEAPFIVLGASWAIEVLPE